VYERDLEKLEFRLEAIYQRYISQFAAMESLVQRMEGIGTYLKGQFTAMENMYKN
jgi:flagellar capping protein FliD